MTLQCQFIVILKFQATNNNDTLLNIKECQAWTYWNFLRRNSPTSLKNNMTRAPLCCNNFVHLNFSKIQHFLFLDKSDLYRVLNTRNFISADFSSVVRQHTCMTNFNQYLWHFRNQEIERNVQVRNNFSFENELKIIKILLFDTKVCK